MYEHFDKRQSPRRSGTVRAGWKRLATGVRVCVEVCISVHVCGCESVWFLAVMF